MRVEVEQRRGESSPGDEHQRAGDRRRESTKPEDHAERSGADEHGRPVRLVERAQPGRELAPRVVTFGGRAGELGQLPDDHVESGSGQEARDDGLGELAIQPMRSSASARNSRPVASAIAATSCAAWAPPRSVTTTAPPATAASDELGPVEMCRDVQKSA